MVYAKTETKHRLHVIGMMYNVEHTVTSTLLSCK